MLSRPTLYSYRSSGAPEHVGMCGGDLNSVAGFVNMLQARLIYCREAGDTGWYGGWAEMAFTVRRDDPYVTTPREVARIERLAVCRRPIPIQNQFYEFLDFSVGPQHLGQRCGVNGCPQWLQVYERNDAVTFVELNPVGKTVRAVYTNSDDIGKRVFLQGIDSNDTKIYSADGLNEVDGIYLVLDTPFVQAPFGITRLTGIQKDITLGPVKFYEVDLSTGDTTLILTMEPSETVASYRRYFFGGLPRNCCADPNNPTTHVLVTAIVKLDLIPVVVDTDYLYIQNVPALDEEGKSYRHSGMDNSEAKQLSLAEHTQAIRYLQGQLVHREGKDRPAVIFAPFGSARLNRINAGMV